MIGEADQVKRSRRFQIAAISGVGMLMLAVTALVVWFLPTAPIVKFRPVCDISRGNTVPESDYDTPDSVTAFLKGRMRQEFKDIITAGYLGDFYRKIVPNDAIGHYRVTPDDIFVTMDLYENAGLYERFTEMAIHTLIQQELWGGKKFPIRLEKNNYIGHKDSRKYLQRDPWQPNDFKTGSGLSRELNADFYDANGNFRLDVFEKRPESYIGDMEFNEGFCAIIRFFSIEGAPPPENLKGALFRHRPVHSREVNERILRHFIEKFSREDRAN
jgi:hypothetical protein